MYQHNNSPIHTARPLTYCHCFWPANKLLVLFQHMFPTELSIAILKSKGITIKQTVAFTLLIILI